MFKDRYRADLINELIEREGGEKYTNRIADRGGPTRWGVTEKKLKEFGYEGFANNLPRAVAVEIYKEDFWDPQCLDVLSDFSHALTVCMFDFGVNSGTGASVSSLQNLLNVLNNKERHYGDVVEDGVMGSKTLYALKQYHHKRGKIGLEILTKSLNALRIAYCVSISNRDEEQEENTYGWLSRVVHLI